MSASECSSGCESGWTMYLDQSSVSATQCQRASGNNVYDDYGNSRAKQDNYEEEDLSMVSDASSGPPHFNEDEDCFDGNRQFCSSSSVLGSGRKNENKKKGKKHGSKQQHSYLDDTASSPVLSFSKKSLNPSNNGGRMDFSQGFSATQFKGKNAFQKSFGYFQSSANGKTASKEPGESWNHGGV